MDDYYNQKYYLWNELSELKEEDIIKNRIINYLIKQKKNHNIYRECWACADLIIFNLRNNK